jgi:hypothetical protein
MMCSICGDIIKAIDHYIAMADDDLKDELEDEGRALPDDSVKMANNLEDGIAAALISETNYFIEQIKKQNSVADLMDLLEQIREQDIVNEEIERVAAEQLKKFIPKMVVHYAMDVDEGIKITAVSKRTTAWIDAWSKELGELMKLNSNTEIENILNKALESGDDIQTVTRTILDSGIRDEYYKARRVALTELFRAHNVSRYEASLQSPCIVSKRWRHSGRGKPRPNHKAMDGVTVPKNEPFVLQGADGSTYYPMHPVDSCLPAGEAVNCHCTVDDVVDEEILGLSTEERQKLRDEALAELDDEWEKSVDEKYRALVGLSTED